MKTEFVLVVLVGIACAFPVNHFYRRGKAGSSEENAVFRLRYPYYLYRYAYMHLPQKQMLTRGNSDSSEENGNGNSSEENYSMEEEKNAGGNQESAEAGGEVSKGNDGNNSQNVDGGKNSTGMGDLLKENQKEGLNAGKAEESDEEAENQNGAESKEAQENENEEKADEAHGSNSTDSSIIGGSTGVAESTTPAAASTTPVAYPFYSSTTYAQQAEGESGSNGNHQEENGGYEAHITDQTEPDPYGENGIVFLEGDGNEKGNVITRGDNFVGYDDEYNYYSNGYDRYAHEYYSQQ